MAEQKKTPGVYIVEENAFPNSVVEVPTGVPAFLGYTQKAARGSQDLTNVPTRLTSLAEFELLFGGPPKTGFIAKLDAGELSLDIDQTTRFLLHQSMRLFFENGGGTCWVVSVGGYRDSDAPTIKAGRDFDAALKALIKEPEPSIVVVPDAVLLPHDDYVHVSNAVLQHCATQASRIAILDVFDGDQARTFDEVDVISGDAGFRNVINNDRLSFGTVYYPWLNTNIVDATQIDFTNVTPKTRSFLADAITAEPFPDNAKAKRAELVAKLTDANLTPKETLKTHHAFMSVSAVYKDAMQQCLALINIMPPSAAMAGVMARTDVSDGVWKAPANVGLVSVLAPTVQISNDAQQDLNVPIDGKAVNAIRTFQGRGVLVWGARTMDGNSQDWRYVNVRRTLIMLEQSIAAAAQAYVFEPNDAGTWLVVQTMIENFLNNQWKAGALAGSTPAEAYQVSIGLGSTMTGNDILDGFMRVTVHVAVSRPAEFIVLTFQQKMQTS